MEKVFCEKEVYEFLWAGKKEALKSVEKLSAKTFFPHRELSKNWEKTQNIYIKADNLDALKILKTKYLNKIRMIYIDPPYNTGKDFTYKDDFTESKRVYNKISANSTGRLHSAWCSMIYPRLKIARELLSDNGVIFISIDSNEVFNLKKICDEIFGEENFITQFIYEKTQHFGRQKFNCYSNADYILCYAKSLYTSSGKVKNLLVEKIKTELEDAPLYNASNKITTLTFPIGSVKFNLPDGVYKKTESDRYELLSSVEVQNGVNKSPLILKFRSRWSQKTVQTELDKGTTFWVKTGTFAIRAIYGDEKYTLIAPRQIIFTNKKNPFCTKTRFDTVVTTSENATKELSNLLGEESQFTYPKSLSLISYLVSLIFDDEKQDFAKDFTVLDFFSGSSTTAHACMDLNSKDNGNRKFIMVQLPESANNTNYKTICDIGIKRIKKAGEAINTLFPNVDTGFRVYTIE